MQTLASLIDYTLKSELSRYYISILENNNLSTDLVDYGLLKSVIKAEVSIFEKFIKSCVEWNILERSDNTLKYISMKDSTVLEYKFKEWMCHEQMASFNSEDSLEEKIKNIKTFLENENIIVESNWEYYLVCFLKEILMRILYSKNLTLLLETGKCVFNHAFQINGVLPFESYKKAERLMEVFSARFAIQWMSNDLCVLKKLHLNSSSILDVGGGSGGLAKALSECSIKPSKYVLLDLKDTSECLTKLRQIFFESLQTEKTIINYDFFHTIAIQEKFDFIFLSWILHDWSDENCLLLLSNIRPLLKKNGKLILVERCMDSQRFSKMNFADFLITATAGGVERTKDEYCSLLKKVNFSFESIMYVKNSRDFLIFSNN